MINKIHPTAKKHGFKSNEDFYAVYPTKESYEKSIFADGGPVTKTYTDKAEYDKALQAYNDSLNLYKFQEPNLSALYNSKSEKEFNEKVKVKENNNLNWNSTAGLFIQEGSLLPEELKDDYVRLMELNKEKPEVLKAKRTFDEGWGILNPYGQINYFKKPVVKPEYKSFTAPIMNEGERQMEARYKPTSTLAKGTLEQEVKPTMAVGTMESEPKPINELMMPSGSYMQKDDFIKRYGEKPWMKATGQKFAFGGFKNKYFNGGTKDGGGSFYGSSNINTSKPQVNNTVPSSYTDTFTGNNSSVPKTTKDGINFSKDGKALTGSLNTNSSGSFSGNYLGMATAAVGGIGTTVNNANAATNERDKNRAIERGTVDTTMDVVGAAFPIVAAVEGVAGGIGTIIDSTNGSTSYTDPNTGKTYSYKKGDSGTSASGFKAAVDPRGNATNFIGDITGTTENYGQSDFGMGVADLFAPFLSQAFRNKQAEKAANQAQMNNSLMNAQGVDSTARNFSAFGGYKNKFPYGGNMKSEVTGQSYLKDQVSDFTSNKFSKHEHGGVMVDSQNEVEAGEIIYKDYVFSERLKDSNGKSFAERAKKLISQIK